MIEINTDLYDAGKKLKFRKKCIKNARKYVLKRKIIKAIQYAMLLIAMFVVAGIIGNAELEPVLAKEQKTKEQTYAKTCVVTQLDYVNNEVIVEDYNGFEWSFKGIDDYDIADIVSLVMSDKGTEIIYDDEIISITYSGWRWK